MPDHNVGSEQEVKLWTHLSLVVRTADGEWVDFPDPTRFWPIFIWNLRRHQWAAVRHNLRHDALRKLLRRY